MDSDYDFAFKIGATNPTLYNGAPRDMTPTEGLFPRSPSPDARTKPVRISISPESCFPEQTLDPSLLRGSQPHGGFSVTAGVGDGYSKA